MYIEVKSHLERIDKTLEHWPMFDSRLDQCLVDLKRCVEFLANKVWEIDRRTQKPAASEPEIPKALDPHRYIPGSDD